jgi:hypothetical protein
MNSKILYELTVEDFQNVAMDELGRELTENELAIVADKVSDSIAWYDIIADAISEKEKEFKKLRKTKTKK